MTRKLCNQKSNFPSFFLFIKEKLGLSTQRHFILLTCFFVFIFSSSSPFHVAITFIIWLCSIFYLLFQPGANRFLRNLSISSSSPCIPCPVFVSLSFVLPVSEVCLLFGCDWDSAEKLGQDRCVGCRDARKPTVWHMLLRPASSASSGPFIPPCKATEAHSAGESAAVNGSRSVTLFESSFIPHCTSMQEQTDCLKIYCGSVCEVTVQLRTHKQLSMWDKY